MRTPSIVVFLVLACAACDKGGPNPDDTMDGETAADTGTDERCEDQATESACTGLTAPADEDWQCGWVEVSKHTATCEAIGSTQAECVTLNFVGADCTQAFACGSENPTGGQNLYIRDAGEDFEVFLLEACEYQPSTEWTQCVWDEESGTISPQQACDCSC